MEPGLVIVVSAMAAAVAAARFFGRGRGVLTTTASQLGAVPPGRRVRLTGVAGELGPLMTSPIGGRPCLAFRLLVEEPGWRPVLEHSACTRFLLVDQGIPVSISGPFRVLLAADYDWKFGNDVQLRLGRLIEEQSRQRPRAGGMQEDADAIYQRNYRYFEALLRPGDRVTVEGFAQVEITPEGTRADLRAPPVRHALTGSPEQPLVVSVPLAAG